MKFTWILDISAGVQVPSIWLPVSVTFHCRLPSRACNLRSIWEPGCAGSPSSSVANASSPRSGTLVIVPLLSLASFKASFCELVAADGDVNRYTLKLTVATEMVVVPWLCWMLKVQLALLRNADALRSARGFSPDASNDLASSPTATLVHMLSGSVF